MKHAAQDLAAIVLAAGGSRRLGRPKQLVTVGGRSLVRHTVDCCQAAGCAPVVVVLGAEAERIRAEIQDYAVEVVIHARWREGLASSIRAGIAALGARSRGAVLAVCDQPRLTPQVIRGLCSAFDGAPGRIVASAYSGVAGVPALFERSCFAELAELCGDRGAQPLLQRHAENVVRVSWPDGAVDVDHPGDGASTQ